MHSRSDRSKTPAALELDALYLRCLGNLDLAERVLAAYQDQLDVDVEELEAAHAAGEADRVRQIAHRMKGASANAGASRIRDEAAAIERLASEGALPDAAACISQLSQERDRLRSTDVRSLVRPN